MATSRPLVVRIGASAPLARAGDQWWLRTAFDISHEMQLAKAALLYADRVTLVSPHIAQVQQWERIAAGDVDDLRMMTLYLEPTWEREFRRLVLPSPDLARALTRRYLARVDKSASWVELKRGVEAGVIELGHLPVVERLGFASGTVLGAMFGFVADSIHPATTEVPLLDKTVAAVLNAGVTTGMFADPLPDDASEVAAAHHYIANVTAFPLVDLDALLDIRAELSGPLIAFRGAMADLAREIDAQPSDERFEREADAAYRRVVAPRLAELRELSEAARILPVLRREILENKGETVVSSAIAFAVAGAAAWPQMAQAAAVALAAGADVASGAYSRYRRIEGERRANKLLWLYEFERTVARHEK